MNAIRMLRMPGRAAIVAAILLVSGGAFLGRARFFKHAPSASTFQVKRQEFLEVLQFRGQVKAMRSVAISAPAEAGDLEILKIAQDGSHANRGDVVVEFDKPRTEEHTSELQSPM